MAWKARITRVHTETPNYLASLALRQRVGQ
jgi:hypothetical protein